MRIIKTVAILMGILIVGGFAVLIWRVYDISSKPRAARPVAETAVPVATPAAAPTAFGALSLGLPAGCEIAEVSADSGRLVLRSSCGTVFIRDLATGAPLGTIDR